MAEKFARIYSTRKPSLVFLPRNGGMYSACCRALTNESPLFMIQLFKSRANYRLVYASYIVFSRAQFKAYAQIKAIYTYSYDKNCRIFVPEFGLTLVSRIIVIYAHFNSFKFFSIIVSIRKIRDK